MTLVWIIQEIKWQRVKREIISCAFCQFHARFVNFLIVFLAYRRGKLLTVGYPAIEPFEAFYSGNG